jgi:ubiquinone/menaquinone biosynthesis C-methylase UbiE
MEKALNNEKTNMTDYNIFAKFYDAVMGKREGVAAEILGLIRQHNPEAKTLLELAAGTGQNLVNLSKDYEVSGLDLSEGMLAVAQGKLPESTFYHQNMVDFKISQKFDVILSLFDSVNHLLNFEDWRRMFENVKRHLNDNGVFIFDVNTLEKLQRAVNDKPLIKELDAGRMEMTVHQEENGVVNWKVKFQQKDSLDTQEENIREKAFPTEEIKRTLEEMFSLVQMREDVSPKTGIVERLYFICKK